MEILKVENLCKTYGKGNAKVDALKNVSFCLEKGEFAAVVGESGSGKSTLLNCIGALDNPTSGKILMDGQNLFSMKEERTIFRRRNIGFIFQSFQLVSELNVEQNIMFPLLLDYRKPDIAAVDEILELLRLSERRNHLPSQLSGGQQQRVAIGRALITKPKLILADEPTGNLDSQNSKDVIDLLMKASRHYQQTILMITHNKSLTASVDRVLHVTDQIKGFELQIDDYIPKPISLPLMIKKIEAVFRRYNKKEETENNQMWYREICLIIGNYRVIINGESIDLTQKEYEILKELMEHPGAVISRESFLNRLWKYEFYGDERAVDNHIKNLRKKLGSLGNYIETVRGVGYRLEKVH